MMMTKPKGLVAIEAEMARQAEDAIASFAQVGPVAVDLAQSLRRTGRLVMLGMGASHAVNRAVEPLYRALGIDALALPVSEQLGMGVPLAGKTVLLVSQSGESAEVIRWLNTQRAGEVFGMSLDGAATLARSAPTLVGAGGGELAFAATRSLTISFALHLAVLAQLGMDPAPAMAMLQGLPLPDVAPAVSALAAVRCVVTSGRRLQGVAEAAALGLCELSQTPAFALEGGQLRHGPMEIMSPDLGVVLFAADEPDAGLVHGMARSASDAGACVVLLDASGADPLSGVTCLRLPKSNGMAAIFAMLPAMQRLLLGYAGARVADLGTPRRSSKITRTE
jgi:fructoselysine-6-P-deglycase FrlB-like protein